MYVIPFVNYFKALVFDRVEVALHQHLKESLKFELEPSLCYCTFENQRN